MRCFKVNEDEKKELDLTNHQGLTKEKKEILISHIGSATSRIDLNKVRDWWKYENK